MAPQSKGYRDTLQDSRPGIVASLKRSSSSECMCWQRTCNLQRALWRVYVSQGCGLLQSRQSIFAHHERNAVAELTMDDLYDVFML